MHASIQKIAVPVAGGRLVSSVADAYGHHATATVLTDLAEDGASDHARVLRLGLPTRRFRQLYGLPATKTVLLYAQHRDAKNRRGCGPGL